VHAEILTIGDELCRGEIVDTNSSWLAGRLWELGIAVHWMSSCRDDEADMLRAFRDASQRAELVFVSGGLGPTEDDLTVDVVCKLLGVAPVSDAKSLERLKSRFERIGFPLTPNNMRQVRVPAGAEVFANSAGLAPGFGVRLGRLGDEKNAAHVFCMPGVPREMQAIFTEGIANRITALAAGSERIAKVVYRTFGKGESFIDHALKGIVLGVSGATVHFQVVFPETLVKLVVRDADAAVAEATLARLRAELEQRLGDLAYGLGDESLASVVGKNLRSRGATVAVAESCTGGMLGSLLTDVAGSSAYFRGGFITYANDVKEQALGVRAETLRAHGAVSEETVREMADGARGRLDSTYGIAISGVAGPDGGTPEKPVGTVHVAVAGPRGTRHKHLSWPGTRDQIRRLSCYWAMALLLADLRDARGAARDA
jgi:nicotinamide-nucleotide amidase